MKTESLKKITSKIGSGSTPRGGQNAYKSQGISLIRSQNVYDFSFSLNGLAFINEEQAEKLKNVVVEKGDILLNITGDSIARTCLVPEDVLPARVNQHVSIIRCKDGYDPRYVNYYLINLKPYLLQICAVGGTRNALTKKALQDLPIQIPSNQKQIAKVLSDLDAKIEINNKINAELEAMAKLIYDYWFVQFDFPISAAYATSVGRPDLTGKPYKSSGGKMVYNEELKREIPEGWEDGVLGDFIELNYGKGLKKSDRSGEGFPVVGSSGIVGYHNTPIVKGPGIVVGRKGTIGKITYMDKDFYPIDTTYYVSPKLDIGFSYLFFLLNSLPLNEMNSDSAVPGLNRSRALTTPLCLIPENQITSFEEFADPIFDMIKKNKSQNHQLAKLRDWLLPMLMNGQVKVRG